MDNEHPSNNLNQSNSLGLIDVIEEMTVDNDNFEDFLQEEYDEEAYVDEVYIENINVEEQMDTNSNEDYYEDSSGNETDTDDLIYSITNSENNVLNNDLEYNTSQEIESQDQEYNTSHEMESPTNDQSLADNCVDLLDTDDEDDEDDEDAVTIIDYFEPTLSIIGKEYLSKINYIPTPQNRIMFPGYNEKVFVDLKNLISNKTLNDFLDTSKVNGLSKIPDLLRVCLPNVWLNDLIIQQYITLMIKNYNCNNVLALSTYFFEIVAKFGFNGYIKREIKGKNLLNYNKIIVPTHLGGNHWCLIAVDVMKRKIIYFDSLDDFFDAALKKMKVLAGFLNEEYLEKRLHLKNQKELTWNVHIGESPLQDNSNDCGIFLCTTARYWILEESINYNQEDIPLIRQRMSYELIHNTMLPTL